MFKDLYLDFLTKEKNKLEITLQFLTDHTHSKIPNHLGMKETVDSGIKRLDVIYKAVEMIREEKSLAEVHQYLEENCEAEEQNQNEEEDYERSFTPRKKRLRFNNSSLKKRSKREASINSIDSSMYKKSTVTKKKKISRLF